MRKALMFSLFAVLFIGGATFAAADCGKCEEKRDCPVKSAKMFDKKDANSDGVISKAEFVTYAEGKFAKMDADSNGSLSKEEVKNYWTAKKKKHKKDSGQCAGK